MLTAVFFFLNYNIFKKCFFFVHKVICIITIYEICLRFVFNTQIFYVIVLYIKFAVLIHIFMILWFQMKTERRDCGFIYLSMYNVYMPGWMNVYTCVFFLVRYMAEDHSHQCAYITISWSSLIINLTTEEYSFYQSFYQWFVALDLSWILETNRSQKCISCTDDAINGTHAHGL